MYLPLSVVDCRVKWILVLFLPVIFLCNYVVCACPDSQVPKKVYKRNKKRSYKRQKTAVNGKLQNNEVS